MECARHRIALDISDIMVHLIHHRAQQDNAPALNNNLDIGTTATGIPREVTLERGSCAGSDLHIKATERQYIDIVDNAFNTFNTLHDVEGSIAVGGSYCPSGQNDLAPVQSERDEIKFADIG